MKTIGFVVAMSQEIHPLLRHIKGWKPARFGKFPGYRFELYGRNCVLVKSGIGMERAILATRALLAEEQPDLLISYGVGGGIETDLHVGDVVLGSISCQLKSSGLDNFLPLFSLTGAALEAITRALKPHGASVACGTIVTTPGSQTLQPSPEILHPVLEMETAGVAEVAKERGIPLLALRALSDTPQEPIPFDIEGFLNGKTSHRLRRILRTFLKHPETIVNVVRLGKNTEKAAENAVLALTAAMSQPMLGEVDPA